MLRPFPMARRRPARRPAYGTLDTIEYIGPRPEVPKRQSHFGGWVILLIAVGVPVWFIRPLLPLLRAEQVSATSTSADLLINELAPSSSFGSRLAAAALQQSKVETTYDTLYYQIPYPNGDIPSGKGKAEDLVVRSYRSVGIDLQKLVHQDMKAHFNDYPSLWDLKSPDPNIDHRRVQNLQRFFTRNGQKLEATRNEADYQPGDIVVWTLANGQPHIGIVVPGPGERRHEPWVVHNLSSSPKWEHALIDFPIDGHYRYPAPPSR